MNKTTEQNKETFTGGDWGTFQAADNHIYITSETNDVARIESGHPVKTQLANAALIAEAKNMYYALKALLEFAPHKHLKVGDWNDEPVNNAKSIINRINSKQ